MITNADSETLQSFLNSMQSYNMDDLKSLGLTFDQSGLAATADPNLLLMKRSPLSPHHHEDPDLLGSSNAGSCLLVTNPMQTDQRVPSTSSTITLHSPQPSILSTTTLAGLASSSSSTITLQNAAPIQTTSTLLPTIANTNNLLHHHHQQQQHHHQQQHCHTLSISNNSPQATLASTTNLLNSSMVSISPNSPSVSLVSPVSSPASSSGCVTSGKRSGSASSTSAGSSMGHPPPSSSPPPNGKKTKGRVKIKMEFINNKLRRYTTFSKRKTGIMKKAYELSTLTGTQVMLLVASETGHVYTFATRKLQPMITSESGKQLIQTCLNSPDETQSSSAAPSAEDQRMAATGFEETDLSYNIMSSESDESANAKHSLASCSPESLDGASNDPLLDFDTDLKLPPFFMI